MSDDSDASGSGSAPGEDRHIQLTFVSKEKELVGLPEAIFDVPVSADPENLNILLNKTIEAVKSDWHEKRFEFLIGETFIRTSLDEFVEEYEIPTETVIKVECILGQEAPKPLHDLAAPDWVSSVHCLPSFIFSTTYNGEAVFWDRKAGTQLASIQREKGVAFKCGAIVRTGKGGNLSGTEYLVGGDNQTITLLKVDKDSAVEKVLFRGHERSVESVTVNSDSTRFLSGSFDSHIKLWNLQEDDESTVFEKVDPEKTKKRKETFVTKTPIVTLGGHKDAVVAVTWSPWSQNQAVSASWDHTIVVWDVELAGEVTKIRAQRAFTSLDVNNKSGLVVAGSSDEIPRLYDPRSSEGTLVKQAFIGHKGWVSSVAWNPDDERCFASASYDKSIKMWDIRSAKTSMFDIQGHADRALCVDWNYGLIASGSVDCTVKVFKV